jgi:hypothetical protein
MSPLIPTLCAFTCAVIPLHYFAGWYVTANLLVVLISGGASYFIDGWRGVAVAAVLATTGELVTQLSRKAPA